MGTVACCVRTGLWDFASDWYSCAARCGGKFVAKTMARLKGEIWTDVNSTEHFVVYFAGTRADGWVGLRYEPTKVEVQTLWSQRISRFGRSPQWWSHPPDSYLLVRTDYWDS